MIKKLLFFILFFSFAINVNASSYTPNQFTGQLYDNLGPTLSSVTTSSNEANHSGIIPLQSYSSGGAWGISSPTVMLANHTYTLTANVIPSDCGSLTLSTYNRIGVGTSLGNAVISYQNNTNVTENYSKVVGSYLIQFAFTPTINSSYIVFAFSTTSSCSSSQVFLTDISFDDLGSTGVTEIEINNSLNSQTNQINSSIQNSTNTITGVIGDTETNINNSINDMGESINDNINNNFQSCGPANKNLVDFKTFVSGYPSTTGQLTNTVGSVGCRRTPNLIKVKPNTTYTFSIKSTTTDFEKWIGVAFYKSNATSTFIKRVSTDSNTFTFTTTSETNYIAIGAHNITGATQVQFELGNSSTSYIEYQEECNNKIDETNSQLNDLNNNITNNNVSGVEESFSQFEDFLDDNSTITQLITLPVTLYSSILQGVSNSCTPFNLGNLYGESLILPCVNIGNYLGSTLWGMIDLIISGFAIYSISKKLIKVFNNFSSMKDGDVIDD